MIQRDPTTPLATSPRIMVVGSINMDLVASVRRLPARGETVQSTAFRRVHGGKGANQAVAAARAGGDVLLLGRVGSDDFGASLRTGLAESGVGCDLVFTSADTSSGTAIVLVEETGENSIVVVPGANSCVSRTDVEAAAEQITSSDVLLLQLEVPLDAVSSAARLAADARRAVILDPAPITSEVAGSSEFAQLLQAVTVICPNETEASVISGVQVNDQDSAIAAARRISELGPKVVIVTRGHEGCVLIDNSELHVLPSTVVEAVDSTAAGDAFAGAFAVRLCESASHMAAARFACLAGAIATSRSGAQPAMPQRGEIDSLLATVTGTS